MCSSYLDAAMEDFIPINLRELHVAEPRFEFHITERDVCLKQCMEGTCVERWGCAAGSHS